MLCFPALLLVALRLGLTYSLGWPETHLDTAGLNYDDLSASVSKMLGLWVFATS